MRDPDPHTDPHTGAFEAARPRLEGVAYRMLGTLDEARDVVQETWLRWNAVDPSEVRDPRAWLVTACSRLAMDSLRGARLRRAEYPGPWLPEPLVEEEEPEPSAAERAEIDESLSVALLVALERLTPAERAAVLLHDVFGYAFAEIGTILGRSEARLRGAEACRALHDAGAACSVR